MFKDFVVLLVIYLYEFPCGYALNATTVTTTAPTTTTTTTTAPTTTIITTTPKPEHFPKSVIAPKRFVFECNFRSSPTKVDILKDGSDFFSVRMQDFKYDKTRFNVRGGTSKLVITLRRTQFDDQGNYECYVYYGAEKNKDQSYSLTVYSAPVISINPTKRDYKLFKSDGLKITCSGIGRPKVLIKWTSTDYQVSNGSTLEILSFTEVKNYTFVCKGANGYGSPNITVHAQVADSKPSPPLEFKATKELIKEKEITLEWTKNLPGNSALNHYDINGNQIAKDVTVYTATGLEPYHSYTYILTASNIYGLTSDPVNLTVMTLEQARPSEPTNLKINSYNSNSISLNFEHGIHMARKNISYSRVCHYVSSDVTISCGTTDSRECNQVNPNVNQYVITGLLAYQHYIVTVETCINSSKDLICSFCTKTNVSTERDVSSEVQSTKVENDIATDEVDVSVTWERPLYLNAPYVTYKISYHKQNDKNISVDTPFRTNLTKSMRFRRNIDAPYQYTLKKLDGGTLYSISVVAVNSKGEKYGDDKTIITDNAVPTVPVDLKCIPTSKSLHVSWKPPTSSPLVTSYILGWRNMEGSILQKYDRREVNDTEFVITALKEKTNYKIFIKGKILHNKNQINNAVLIGPKLEKEFSTIAFVPPPEEINKMLIVVTVVMVLLLIIVIIGAVLYCRRHGLCSLNYSPTFYIDDKKEVVASFAFSLRQSLKTLEIKRVPMTLPEFQKHIKDLHANSDYLFSEEYGSLGPNRPDRTFHSAHSEVNVRKNRYVDIAAYDQTRVRLMSLAGVPGSNYINANFIDGYHKDAAYIATQAPLNHTVSDFWRMIWESNSRVIVMLTNLMEKGRRKCDQYWPTEGTSALKGFDVSLESTQHYANFIIRQLMVSKKSETSPGESRTIWQYHYTEWPDFGVPRDTVSVLSFILRTREHENEADAPPIVHCSAGVGRTGTFMIIDAQMRRYDHRQDIEIYNYLKSIRQQRSFLVQQEGQYIFIHNAILDYALAGTTQIPLMDLEINLNQDYWTTEENKETKLQKEWKLHESFTLPPFQQSSGQRPCNRPKNRDQTFLPSDINRVHLLMRAAVEGSDYINASFISSYHLKNAYIVTQTPLQHTIEDFWRMICERNSHILINLLTLEEMDQDGIFPYIPIKKEESLTFGKFEIKLKEDRAGNNFVKRTLLVTDSNSSRTHEVHHFHYYNWTADFYPRTAFLFELIFEVLQLKQTLEDQKTPMVIHCRYGVGRSGLLCALFNLKEQIEDVSKIIDVFSTVRMLSCQRSLIIQKEADYDFLYKALVSLKHYLNRHSVSSEVDV